MSAFDPPLGNKADEFFDDDLSQLSLHPARHTTDPGILTDITPDSPLNAKFPTLAQRTLTNAQGITTHVLCNTFSDRHFFIVSQTRRFGTLISAWAEDRLDGGGKSHQIRILTGQREDELLDVYAKQIVMRLAEHSSRPLLLSVALAEGGRDVGTFQQVVRAVEEMHGWAPLAVVSACDSAGAVGNPNPNPNPDSAGAVEAV